MRNDFAVFILTHERVNEQKTLETLSTSGYTGKVFLIVDDEDKQLQEYKDKYGSKVIVFSKREVDCDTLTNQEEWRSVVYARNAVNSIAENMGLRYVFMCDDDITRFTFRVVRDGKLKGFKVNNIGRLLNKMADNMENGNISIFGFSQQGAYFGGANSDKYRNGCQRTCSQAMIVDTKAGIPWRGIFGEDLQASLDAGAMGKVVLSTMLVSIESPERTTNAGGLHDLYHSNNQYVTYFQSVLPYPSTVKVFYKNGEAKHRIKQACVAPMIVSDRYRKEVAV